MVNYFIFTVFVVFISFLDCFSKRIQYGLLLSFCLIFVATAIRYDFGNDYLMYAGEFTIINSGDRSLWSVGMNRLEQGWIYLNKLFGFASFEFLIGFLSLMYCLVFYFFIKNTLDKTQYWISILFLLLIPGLFIVQQTLLRQTLALLLFLVAIMLVEKRRGLMWGIIILISASFFHFSALLLIPVLFTKYLHLTTKQTYFIVGFYVMLFFVGYSTYVTTLLFDVINYVFPKYSYYLDPERNNKIKLNTGLGLAFSTANFFLILYLKDHFLVRERTRIIFFSIVIFYLVSPMSLILGHFQRFNIYFEVFMIIIIPMVYSFIHNKKLKYIYLCCNIIFSSYSLITFFKSDTPEQKFNIYQTILNKRSI
ncbi:EpsG family protein [Chryseobacterium koreense]